jgi:hypothetical protein
MAYTAFGNHAREKVFQIGLTSIPLERFGQDWRWEERRYSFPGIRNKNALLLPKKIGGKIFSSTDLILMSA